MSEQLVIIPAYNPDEKLLKLLDDLKQSGFSHILIVNDGSRPDCSGIFEGAANRGGTILRHAINMGKGRALKTAFNYAINHYGPDVQAVCADADGQHTAVDIDRIFDVLSEFPDCLVLGCRQFDDRTIPLRSRFGNKLTRFVFKLLCGVRVADTQTGLRGLSGDIMKRFLSSKGERFEYEMNMLIDAKEKGVSIREVPIETIYIEENQTSHFNPLRDSIRIYAVFAKFILSSITAFLIDFLLFWIFTRLFRDNLSQTLTIVLSTLFARAVSSLVNYLINKKRVFRVEAGRGKTMLRYYILCLVQICCSAGLVDLFTWLTRLDEILIKLPVDFCLFIISFQIQREWVFRKTAGQQQMR